jgi:hypothetical protein
MKDKELIKNLQEFQKKLIEHQTLYNNSFPKYSEGMYPVRNTNQIEKQSCWLYHWWRKNQSILNQFRGSTKVQSPTAGDERDYTNSAIGLNVMAPIKTRSLKKLIAEVEQIIDRLASMNATQDVYRLSENFEKVEQISASNASWSEIKNDFGISKRTFGRKIHFVKNEFKRKILFRDIGQAYFFAEKGFSKPAVILAGSVIEELLRLYLKYKKISPSGKSFNECIIACDNNGLFKKGISKLSDSLRDFRNIVHLKNEVNKRYTISKATAKGAISSIFTISNDF